MEDELVLPEQPEASPVPTAIPAEDGDARLVAAVLNKDRKATADFVAQALLTKSMPTCVPGSPRDTTR